MIKRIFDIVTASLALFFTMPLIAIGMLAVKLTSPGPAFYLAKRAGKGGTSFDMVKLRTMRTGLDSVNRRVTAENDDRITPVGALLRKCKLDELPQFWNVLRGDMSIVGPRPEDWNIVQTSYTSEQMRTLDVRPGIASLAEVRWYPDLTYHDPPPTNTPIQEWYLERHMPAQLAESLRYVDEQSFWLDLQIIAKTVYCIIFHSWVPPKKQPLTPIRQESA